MNVPLHDDGSAESYPGHCDADRIMKEQILDDVVEGVSAEIRDAAAHDFDAHLASDLPPQRVRPTGDSNNEILSRSNDPGELTDMVRGLGYRDVQHCWHNSHPASPINAVQMAPFLNRQRQIDPEGDPEWSGMFLCSARVIEATKTAVCET